MYVRRMWKVEGMNGIPAIGVRREEGVGVCGFAHLGPLRRPPTFRGKYIPLCCFNLSLSLSHLNCLNPTKSSSKIFFFFFYVFCKRHEYLLVRK